MKPYIPQIRIISVDHDRTSVAVARLRHSLDCHSFKNYKVQGVFCHLEAGRCGVASGLVAIEVDGRIIWLGKELTEELAEKFCAGIGAYVHQQMQDLGMPYRQ